MFTTNQVQAAPVTVSREHLTATGGRTVAVLVNSGCANACTGSDGLRVARASANAAAAALGCRADEVLVCSTGVIGVGLPLDRVERGITSAAAALGRDGHSGRARDHDDRSRPEGARGSRRDPGRRHVHVGGIAKGAGMIEPMLATMLAFLTTDAEVEPPVLGPAPYRRRSRRRSTRSRWMASVRPTTRSPCSRAVRAASAAGDGDGYEALVAGLTEVCRALALMIVRGGEGATKLVAVRVTGAATPSAARQAAKTIANSPLVKTAIHGGDPNWGRLVAAAGRSGVPFRIDRARVEVGPGTAVRRRAALR